MSQAIEDHTTSPPAGAMHIGGAAFTPGLDVPVGTGADAELLSLCAKFMELDAHMRRFDEPDGPERMTAEEIGDMGVEWDALVPRITAIPPRTGREIKAKAEVAFWIMRTADEVECEDGMPSCVRYWLISWGVPRHEHPDPPDSARLQRLRLRGRAQRPRVGRRFHDTDPDAELISTCHRFAEANWANFYRYVLAPDDLADEEAEDPDWDTYHWIIKTPATTREGWHAKALAFTAWDREAYDDHEDDRDPATTFLAALLRDMVAPARNAIVARCAAKYVHFHQATRRRVFGLVPLQRKLPNSRECGRNGTQLESLPLSPSTGERNLPSRMCPAKN